MTVKEFQNEYYKGNLKDNDVQTQINAGWFDWFCSNGNLSKRTRRVAQVIKRITNQNLFDAKVVLKNVCPVTSNLYDIIYLQMEEIVIGVCIYYEDNGANNLDHYEIFTSESGYENFKSFDDIKELADFLNNEGWRNCENFKSSDDIKELVDSLKGRLEELID